MIELSLTSYHVAFIYCDSPNASLRQRFFVNNARSEQPIEDNVGDGRVPADEHVELADCLFANIANVHVADNLEPADSSHVNVESAHAPVGDCIMEVDVVDAKHSVIDLCDFIVVEHLERAGSAVYRCDRSKGARGYRGLNCEGQHRKLLIWVGHNCELDTSSVDKSDNIYPLRPKAATAQNKSTYINTSLLCNL